MGEISKFDQNYEKSQQVKNVVDGKSLNLKGDPTNNNALYTDATVSSSSLPTGAATSAKQLADNHQVTVSNPTADPETGLATSAKQLLDGHNVTVDNANGSPVPTNEIQATGINGGDASVGTTQVEMAFTGATKSIMIQSKVSNTGSIWIGLIGVTNVGGNAFTQLSPGQSVSIDLNDASAAIYAISDVVSQTVYKAAIT